MAYRPNEGKGTEVEEDVLCYKQVDAQGHVTYARVLGWVNDKLKGLRHAWVLHPRYGMEEMNPREGRIEGFEPVRAVLRERYDAEMSALHTRVDELEAFVVSVKAAQAARAALALAPPAPPVLVAPAATPVAHAAKSAKG